MYAVYDSLKQHNSIAQNKELKTTSHSYGLYNFDVTVISHNNFGIQDLICYQHANTTVFFFK